MVEILKNDLVIELLTKEGTNDSTVSAPFEYGTSFLTLHIDKDGNLFTYYLGRGSLDVHYLENKGAESLLELIKLYFSIPVRDSEVRDLRKVLVVEGYRNFAPKGSEVESQLEGYLKEHGIYALV